MHLPSLIYGPMHLSSLIYGPMALPCLGVSGVHLVWCAYGSYSCLVANAVFSCFITTPPQTLIAHDRCAWRHVCIRLLCHLSMPCVHTPAMPSDSMRLKPSNCASPNNTRTHRHNFCTKYLCDESSTHTHTYTRRCGGHWAYTEWRCALTARQARNTPRTATPAVKKTRNSVPVRVRACMHEWARA